jgi:Conjugal transfer protein TrbH
MRAFLLLLALSLVACAPTKGLQVADIDSIAILLNYVANDSVRQLEQFYPPSSTAFNVSASDKLGNAFSLHLRKKGYSIVENSTEGKPLEYVLDSIDNKYYRVSVFVDNAIFSRLYVNESPVVAVGSWAIGGKNEQ